MTGKARGQGREAWGHGHPGDTAAGAVGLLGSMALEGALRWRSPSGLLSLSPHAWGRSEGSVWHPLNLGRWWQLEMESQGPPKREFGGHWVEVRLQAMGRKPQGTAEAGRRQV